MRLRLPAAGIRAATVPLTRKRITWCSYIDIPVGLTARPAEEPGTEITCQVIFGEPGLSYAGPYPDGTVQAWLVLLGITNPGLAPVRDDDFSTPLAFTFPGRQVFATQIRHQPAARTASQIPQAPAAQISAASGQEPGHASDPARMQLSGFQLRPKDSYSIMLLLTGAPASDYRHIYQEGSLTGGKIILCAEPGS